MGTDRLLPPQFAGLHPRYRTPAFGTVLVALVTIVITTLAVLASTVASAFNTIVTTTEVLYALFYAMSALANTWYYRSLVSASLRDALIVGILPMMAVAFLLWISVKSFVSFPPGAKWTLVGIAARA